MPARYFRDESALFNRLTQQQAFMDSYEADEALAQNVAAHYNAYPQTDPGVSLALAKAGYAPDSPVALEAAKLSQQTKAKKGGGGFWGGIGDMIRAGSGAIGDVIDAVDDPILTGIKGAARVGTTVLSAPFEEAAGLVRSTAGAIGGRIGGAVAGAGAGGALGAAVGAPIGGVGALPGALVGGGIGLVTGFLGGDKIESEDPGFRFQSTLAQAVSQLDEKGGVQLGSGFLPGGRAAEVAVQERRRTAQVAGRALTPGRLIAAGIVEPGTTPYNMLSGTIDFANAIKLDPVAIGGLKLAKVRAARRTILPEKVPGFLNSTAGAALVDDLTGRLSPYEIWEMSKRQFSVDAAVRLADNTDAHGVRQILESELGTNVRTVFKPKVSRRIGKRRLTLDMPVDKLEWDLPHEFMEKVDSLQALGRVDTETRLANNDQIMRALAQGRGARLDAVRAVSNSVADVLIAQGLPRAEAKRLARIIPQNWEDTRLYTAAEIGNDAHIPGLAINDAGTPIASPSLWSELLDSDLPLPSRQQLREIRQFSSKMSPLFQTKAGAALQKSDIVATWMMNKVWKAGVLLRLAIVPRVTGEEQVRMAAAGLDSIFSHPMSAVAWMVGKRGKVSFKGDILDEAVEAQAALSGAHQREGFFEAGGLIRAKGRQQFRPGEDGFIEGWLNHELGHLRSDPVAQHYAKHGAQATKDWLWNGAGRKFLNDFRRNRPNDPTFMANELDVHRYVDDVIGGRVQHATQGDQRLIDAIASGLKKGSAEKKTVQELRNVLDELDEAGTRPGQVVGSRVEISRGEKAGEIADQAVTTMFSFLMERPTNFLNRAPAFKQFYWQRGEEIITDLAPEAQRTLIANAEKAGLSRAQVQRLRDRAAVGSGDLNLDHADTVAKAFALEEVRGLLYDLSKKGMWADSLRLVAPFAEPWKEMMTTWSKLALPVDQAGVLGAAGKASHLTRRFQQTVEGARGAGFFQVDEQTGEEMFVYPGSAFISKLVTGAPIPLRGRVAGLNLFAQNPVLPGAGPLVQIPAGALIPDKPEFDWLQDVINPFGRSDESVVEQLFMPAAWVDKVRKATADPESDRVFGNTVFDAATYLVSTGKYSISTPEEQQRTSEAAINMARKLYFLRIAGSFGLPAAPSPQMLSAIKGEEGRVMTQWQLSEEFRKLQNDPEVDYNEAVQIFLDRFGEDALLYMQPKTEGGAPPVEDLLDWARSNPDLVDKYPEVYQYFGPSTGAFSFTAYERQIASGQRKALKPEEAIKLGNHRVASMRWQQVKDKIGPRPNSVQRDWLDRVKSALIEEYPGWQPEPSDIGATSRRIRQLQGALDEEKLASTEVGKALSTYFKARDIANQSAKDAGFASFSRAKAMQPVREWLRNIAHALIDERPEFADVYERVLEREMADDTPQVDQELPALGEG